MTDGSLKGIVDKEKKRPRQENYLPENISTQKAIGINMFAGS